VSVSVSAFALASVSVSVAMHPPNWKRRTVRLSASRTRNAHNSRESETAGHGRAGVCSRSRSCCIRSRSRRNAIFVAVAVAVAMTRAFCISYSVFCILYFGADTQRTYESFGEIRKRGHMMSMTLCRLSPHFDAGPLNADLSPDWARIKWPAFG